MSAFEDMTVTSADPLLVQRDGDATLTLPADTMVTGLRDGDRVRVENDGGRLIVHGRAGGLDVAHDIPTAADLNDYVTPGPYHQGSNAQAAAGSNYPAPYAGLLEVRYAEDGGGTPFVYQRYTVYQAHQAAYYRTQYDGTWGAWKRLDDSSLPAPVRRESTTATLTITASSFASVAAIPPIEFAEVPNRMLVQVNMWAWLNNASGSDVRIQVNVTGDTTDPSSWQRRLYSGSEIAQYAQYSTSYFVEVEAGTTEFDWQAYRVGSGTVQAVYAGFEVVPIRWL